MKHSSLLEQVPLTPPDKLTWEKQIISGDDDLILLLKKINARNRALEDIKRVARRCIRLCEKMKNDSGAADSLNKAEDELKRKTKTIIEVSVYLARRIKIVDQHTGDLRNMDQALQFSSALYSDLVKACENFEAAYKSCAENARAQLQDAKVSA